MIFSLGEKVYVYKIDTQEAGITPNPAPVTPPCPLSLSDFPSTTFPEWWFFTFIIFWWTGLSNSYFESAFLLFPFVSSYLNICAGLIKGTQVLLLTIYHCWLYLLLCTTFTSRLWRRFFWLPPSLVCIECLWNYFLYHILSLVHLHLLTRIWYLIYSPFIWKLRMRKQHSEEKRSLG